MDPVSEEELEAARRTAETFREVALQAWTRGLVAGSGGNLSIRVEQSESVLMKPSGRSNIECSFETLLLMDVDGDIRRGEGVPSRDATLHLAIYRARNDVGGIVHAHVPWATALTLLGCAELPLITPHSTEKLGHVPTIPYVASGSDELIARVVRAVSDEQAHAVLLAQHGMVSVGRTLVEAEQTAELVEETAKIAYLVLAAGGQLPHPAG